MVLVISVWNYYGRKNFKMLEHQEVFAKKKSQAMDRGDFSYGAANLLPRVKTVHR